MGHKAAATAIAHTQSPMLSAAYIVKRVGGCAEIAGFLRERLARCSSSLAWIFGTSSDCKSKFSLAGRDISAENWSATEGK